MCRRRCLQHACCVQAPAKGGAPFIVSSQRLPEMVASLNRVSKACRTVANVCIGVGAVLVAVKAVQGALLLWQRRKHRCASLCKGSMVHHCSLLPDWFACSCGSDYLLT